MATVTKVEQELRDATGIKPKSKQGRQSFLKDLALGVQELKDEDWEVLSKAAQTWSNAAGKVLEADKNGTVVDFEGADGDAGADDKEEASPKKKPAAAAPKSGAKPATGGKKKDEEDAPKKRTSSELKEGGIKVQIKKLLLKKPDMSVDDIVAAIAKKGDAPSRFTVSSIRSEFRHSLKVMKAEGLIDIDV